MRRPQKGPVSLPIPSLTLERTSKDALIWHKYTIPRAGAVNYGKGHLRPPTLSAVVAFSWKIAMTEASAACDPWCSAGGGHVLIPAESKQSVINCRITVNTASFASEVRQPSSIGNRGNRSGQGKTRSPVMFAMEAAACSGIVAMARVPFSKWGSAAKCVVAASTRRDTPRSANASSTRPTKPPDDTRICSVATKCSISNPAVVQCAGSTTQA